MKEKDSDRKIGFIMHKSVLNNLNHLGIFVSLKSSYVPSIVKNPITKVDQRKTVKENPNILVNK
ncbi:hypothetical protein GCM10009430_40120 [Aquimarina litoralis]|uniref:Uncharacterized protein n=1 Tax=Aquimarina litoralis TaxID=584605 RepID=A0ABN1J662_9FLAO